MDIFSFLKSKLAYLPQTVTSTQMKAAQASVEQSDMLAKFGLVTSDLREALSSNDLINFERSSLYTSIDRSLVHPIMSGAVGLFADCSSTYNRIHGATVWVTAKNKEYQYQIEKLFEIVNLEEEIYDLCWSTATFGDLFWEVHAEPGLGVVSVNTDMHPIGHSRIDYNGKLVGFYCLSGNTKIKLLDNTNPTIKEMSKNPGKYIGKSIKSVNTTTNKIEEDKILEVNVTRRNAELVKVYLTNSFFVISTPDHKFMLSDCSFKPALELAEGDELKSEDGSSKIEVTKVEKLIEREDTYDLTVEKNHNFLLDAGIFISNSTPGGYSAQADRKLMAPWDLVHFRLLGAKRRRPQYGGADSNYSEFRTVSIMAPDVRRLTSKYGSSVLSEALPIFKRLRLAEDSILMARITRGVLRNIWKVGIDKSNSNNEAIGNLLDSYISTLKEARSMNIDTNNPSYNSKFSAMSNMEDIIIPVWGDVNQVAVDKIGGDVDIKWICLRGDVKIKLLNGSSPTIKDMFLDKDSYVGKEVYSCTTDGEIVARKINDIKLTRKDATFVRVTLDNGESFDVTPDHRCMLRNGGYKNAELLEVGESLMPLYTRMSTRKNVKDYEEVYNPKTGRYKLTHQVVARDILLDEYNIKYKELIETGLEKYLVVHHKDVTDPRNRFNNSSTNLKWMGSVEHFQLHSMFSNALTKYNKTEASRENKRKCKIIWHQEHIDFKPFDNIIDRVCECGLEFKNEKLSAYMNHLQWNCPKRVRTVRDAVSIETRNKLSVISSNKRWVYNKETGEEKLVCSEVVNEYITNSWNPGRAKFSDEAIKNMRVRHLGKRWIHNVELNKSTFVLESSLLEYLSNGWELGKMIKQPVYMNHKVVKVEHLTCVEDAYDLTIDGNEHNFAIGAGVFVHNCDVDLLTKQLSTALAIPLPLLAGYAQEANGGIGQNSLEKLDIRFARQARRIQRAVIAGLTRLAQIHLAYQGINPDLSQFQIVMSETSTAEELELQDALDKGLDVTGKVMDMLERTLGPDLDKQAALKYMNEKFLKLNDMDLDKLMLKGNPNAFNVPAGEDTLGGGGGSTGGSSSFGSAPATGSDSGNPFAEHATTGEDVAGSTEEPSTKPEEGEPNKGDESGTEDKEEENPFHENLNISDLHSLTPLLESRKSWEETWGKTVVKITPTKK